MGRKRLTYEDENGKRHWVAIRKYFVPEGIVFVPAENQSVSGTHSGQRTADSGRSLSASGGGQT